MAFMNSFDLLNSLCNYLKFDCFATDQTSVA